MPTIFSVITHTFREAPKITEADPETLQPFLDQVQLLDKLNEYMASRRGLVDVPPHLGPNNPLYYYKLDKKELTAWMTTRFQPGETDLINEVM